MPHALHHSPRHFTPHYGLSPARRHCELSTGKPTGFRLTFRQARYARHAAHLPRDVANAPGASNSAPRASGIWPAAFAVLFVANLVVPTSGAIPRRNFDSGTNDASDVLTEVTPDSLHQRARVPASESNTEASASGTAQPDDVDIRLVERARFKTDYTMMDMLRIVAASRSPFEAFGGSLSDAYEVLADEPVTRGTHKSLVRGGKVLDVATGLVPQVRLSRLPGDVSYVAAQQIDGKPPVGEDMLQLMQALDPRTLQAEVQKEVVTPDAAVSSFDASHAPIGSIKGTAHGPAPKFPGPATPEARASYDASLGHDAVALPAASSEITRPVAPIDASPSATAIVGEREHLAGYEQAIAADRLPPGDITRVMLIDGHTYLSGDHGYYRVTKGAHENLWFVDAPRRNMAQVPVTLDAETGEWRADAPLRLCGGGCGQSSMLPGSDSIVDEWTSIASAISHLTDLDTQDAIQAAFGNLSSLQLLRGNRVDLRATRDYSIAEHRAALRKAMRNIDREAPLEQQQEEAAAATAMYYSDNPHAEAFCQENAEILFHLLLEGGVPIERIRMVTLNPQHRPPHVVVLYTESEALVDMLHLVTPEPGMYGRPNGIGRTIFTRAVLLTRDSTLILDPWGRTKVTGFANAETDFDVQRQLDRVLATMGHAEGHPFTISLTRPLGAPPQASRPRSALSGGSASSGASGASSGDSPMSFADMGFGDFDPSVLPDSPSSPDDASVGDVPES